MTDVPISSGTPAGASGIYRLPASKGPFSPGTKAYVQHNFGATGAPGVGDDDADKYGVGSLWYDTTNENLYICKDATTGAAVWRQLSYGATIATLKDALNDAVAKGRRVLSSSAVAGSNHTGTVSETVVKTVQLPANALGANGVVVVNYGVSRTGSAAAVITRVRLGGISGDILGSVNVSTSNVGGIFQVRFQNRNATNSQIGGASGNSGIGGNANALLTGTKDTTANQDIVITFELGSTGDGAILEYSSFEIIRG